MKINVILIVFLFTFTSALFASPSSLVAWTTETLRLVAAGNAEEGEKQAKICASCHGNNGIATLPDYPYLAGQLRTYLYKQLRDYADGKRIDPIMQNMVSQLSDEDMANIAAWYSSLPLPSASNEKPSELELAEKLVFQGEENRIRNPCVDCHGRSGQGAKIDIPALAGQSVSYLEKTLQAYKNGSRSNDIYSRMRLLSKNLTDSEIKELAQYYHALQ